jgi:hypothetical protein
MFDRNLPLTLKKVNKNLKGATPIIHYLATLFNPDIKSKNACKNCLISVIYSISSKTGGGR